MKIHQILSNHLITAMSAAGIPSSCSPMLSPCNRPEFGEYQANGAMAAAKQMKTNPRALAEKIVSELDLSGIARKVEIAGPGFINIHLAPEWLASMLEQQESDASDELHRVPADEAKTVVVDYSSPNLAKEMHVGHLRSTIIGDAMARVLEFQGHQVIRQNHVGDWGTQFGMLIAHLEDINTGNETAGTALADLEQFYRQAKLRFDDEPSFADRARDYVVKLQSGDARCLELWQQFIDTSVAHSEEIYSKLNVTLKRSDIHAESAYNEALPGIVSDLQAQALLVEDASAKVVFLDELADKEGNPLAMIIQKSDGGYLYATTDLAAMRYRNDKLNADRILYFIDARQSLHMKQVFTLSRRAGYARPECSLEHHPFGTMMGEDGKPFKTRAGGTVKLAELLDEAVNRAQQMLKDKGSELPADEQLEVAEKIGIGAVKYADLAKTRTNDYIFSWERMLSFEGNTAPYLQYAYTRIRSIFRKAGLEAGAIEGPIALETSQEKDLALQLLRFDDLLQQVAEQAYPHLLCNYLYELASFYMRFYEACPVLKDDVPEEVRNSRLRLCRITADTLACGLDLLGIEVVERM